MSKDIGAKIDRGIFRSFLSQNLLKRGRNKVVQEHVIQLMRLVISRIHGRLIIPTCIKRLIFILYLFYRLGDTVHHLHGKYTLVVIVLTTLNDDNQGSSCHHIITYV